MNPDKALWERATSHASATFRESSEALVRIHFCYFARSRAICGPTLSDERNASVGAALAGDTHSLF
jgi:hypothetical protein